MELAKYCSVEAKVVCDGGGNVVEWFIEEWKKLMNTGIVGKI